jgi:hypothetical protein
MIPVLQVPRDCTTKFADHGLLSSDKEWAVCILAFSSFQGSFDYDLVVDVRTVHLAYSIFHVASLLYMR